MASRLLSSFLLILILISCSTQEDRIDYESEFESIVIEFEKSSILNFDRKQLNETSFIEDFFHKLDKEKTTFLAEDINRFKNQDLDKGSYNYANLKSIVELYYQRYQESLKIEDSYLILIHLISIKKSLLNLKLERTTLKMRLQKQTIKEKLLKMN
jgi:hypothetical protein